MITDGESGFLVPPGDSGALAAKLCEAWVHPRREVLPGRVVRFAESLSVKVPHTGWNQVEARRDDPLFRQIPKSAYAYFNHSYYCQADDPSDVSAETEYGIRYACAVQNGNIFGVQFHPEKSQQVGLQILRNFVEAG